MITGCGDLLHAFCFSDYMYIGIMICNRDNDSCRYAIHHIGSFINACIGLLESILYITFSIRFATNNHISAIPHLFSIFSSYFHTHFYICPDGDKMIGNDAASCINVI
jgi:hypothetical protein